ncbi:DUF998 domain-containing protein [Actinomadura sp. WMMA1423]|uniref:DUF998 domain-containing protein n=1 Tax=Actinomadura sp. WMMA1423 TaxID=2591108 RepID=UPI0011474E76|nr:DUF998 domain-containing protein [Actinomadura sp. WMMA1423]
MATATAPPARTARRTSRALVAGALAGPLFFASALAQMVMRDGFDITRHPISQLATGELGWIQIVTFVLAGLGGVALAAGLRRTITEGAGRRALPVLVAVFGIGLVAAGLLPMDAENGFPAGTPEGPVAQMSWHGVAHSVAAAVAFTALAVAAVVMTVRCVRRRAAWPAVVNGAVALVLLVPVSPEHMSLQIALNGLVAFTWTTVVALLMRRRDMQLG